MDDKHSRPGHGKHDSQGEQKAQEVPPKSSARIESREAFESLRKGEDDPSLFDRLSGFTNSAYRFAKRTTDEGIRVGRALIKSQDQLKLMLAAGQSLKDLREVTGLTIAELSEALNLKDKSLLEAVENGTATLSFELILRLSALLARNDPIPFILRYTRTYNPELWKILNDWGLGRIPLQYEREREFINIYRRHDAARKLSDQGFQHVLKFTREAFEMALHFVAEQEQLSVDEDATSDQPQTGHKESADKNRQRPDTSSKGQRPSGKS